MTTTTQSMRAALLVDEGAADQAIALRDVKRPQPDTHEVLIKVEYAALNHLDVWIRKGKPSVPKPRILGADAAGRIAACGAHAKNVLTQRDLSVGDEVVIAPGLFCGHCHQCRLGDTALCQSFRVLGEHCDGTFSEYMTVPVENIYPKPEHLTLEQSSALMLTTSTAFRMLFTRAETKSWDTVLVWGASAGVGISALQLCKALGVRTIATTRDERKASDIQRAGADDVIVTGPDLATFDLRASLKERCGLDGVDVAFDHLGEASWLPSMQALRKGGRYVTCGATTGAQPAAAITRLFWKQLSMLGSTMASRRDIEQMLQVVRQHKVIPMIDRVFTLDETAAAHSYLEAAQQIGKVVVKVA